MKKIPVILTIISLLAGTSVLTKNFQVSAHEGQSQEEVHESLSAQIHEHESSDENEDNDDQDENESPEPSETPEASATPSISPSASPSVSPTPTASPVVSPTPSASSVASTTPSVSPTPTASPLVLGANVNGSLLETISNLLKQLISLIQNQGQRD